MENSKNLTNEKENLPFFMMKRLDCVEQQAKTGEIYYMFNGIVRFNDRSQLVSFFTRDKDLYADVLSIPVNKDFKVYYELYLDYQNNWKVKPVAVSL